MWRQYIILLVAAFLTTTYGRSAISSVQPFHLRELKNVHYDGGVPWMLIPDDEGVLHIAILTEISPPVTRDVAADVQLNLYTNSNGGSTPYRLLVNDIGNLANSGFNPQQPTKILIHGFGGSGQSGVVSDTKNAYLATGNYNVIGVDWGLLAAAPNYVTAAQNTRTTGAHIAELIDFLVTQAGAKLVDFHIIGHSLGGHVAGFAGKSTTTGKVGRITGLDSAFPLFANEGPDGRLDAGDAILVDTIHTCSGFLGLREPYGHVDFYPNKGTMPQPGCGDNDIVGACAHGRSVDFFIFSIRQRDAFPSVECLNLDQAVSGACTGTGTAFMGDEIQFNKYGLFYLDTSNIPVRL